MPMLRSQARDHALAAVLLGAALLFKGLVPAGWMPAYEDGRLGIILCSGWRPAPPEPVAAHGAHHAGHEAPQPSHHSGSGDDPQHDTQQPCTFAGATMPWLGAAEAGPQLAALLPRETGSSFPLIVSVGRGLAAPPPPATGPPLLA